MPTHHAHRDVVPPRPAAHAARRRWQRERAEREQAERRRLQRAAKQEQVRSEAALAVLRQASARGTADLDDLFAWLLTDLAARQRILDLVPVLAERAPDLLHRREAGAMRRLVACPWQRPADTWRPRGKGRDTRLTSLVDHLLVTYPVPRFLYRAFLIPDRGDDHDLDDARLLAHLAAGGSMRAAVRMGWVALPLTRRMGHLFLQAPDTAPIVLAARRAQVLAQGGRARLAPELIASLDRRARHGSRSFWWEAVAWLCRQPDLAAAEVGPLVDYLEHAVQEDPGYCFAGRTLPPMRRAMAAWHAELAHLERLRGVVFEPSGFDAGRWVRQRRVGEAVLQEVWTLEEILCSRELVREGAAMRHCVGSYVDDIRHGEASIWSLRCDGRRVLTVEVDPRDAEMVEARGKFNRPARTGERNLLRRWARVNRVTLAPFV
jgi:hypothetical protein